MLKAGFERADRDGDQAAWKAGCETHLMAYLWSCTAGWQSPKRYTHLSPEFTKDMANAKDGTNG
jgi:hypothetical protein